VPHDPPKKKSWLLDHARSQVQGREPFQSSAAPADGSAVRRPAPKPKAKDYVRAARHVAGGAVKSLADVPVTVTPYGFVQQPKAMQSFIRSLGDRVSGNEPRGLSELVTGPDEQQRVNDESFETMGGILGNVAQMAIPANALSKAGKVAQPRLPGILGPEVAPSSMGPVSDVPAYLRNASTPARGHVRVPNVPAAEPGFVPGGKPRGRVRQMAELHSGEILKRAEGGGFTFDPRTGRFIEGEGFAVANPPGNKASVVAEVTPETVERVLRDNADLLKQDGMMLGGWRDDKTGKFYLEVSQVVPTREEALRLAADRNEIAVFDIGNLSPIENPAYRGPERMVGKSEARAAKVESSQGGGLLAPPVAASPDALPGPSRRGLLLSDDPGMTGIGLDPHGNAAAAARPMPAGPTAEELTGRIARDRERLKSANGEYAEQLEGNIAAHEAMLRRLQGDAPIPGATLRSHSQSPNGPNFEARFGLDNGDDVSVLYGLEGPEMNEMAVHFVGASGAENSVGPRDIRSIFKQLLAKHPDTKKVTGHRVSGARVAALQRTGGQLTEEGARLEIPLPGPGKAPVAAPAKAKGKAKAAPVQSEVLGARDWTPEQLEAYGAQHGLPGLGRVSEPHMVKLSDGREVNIPGGMDGTFSYYDLLALKAQGINPNQLPEGLYKQVHAKIMRTMTPENIEDQDMWRMLSFGITSPNSPLTPNEFTVSRLMAMSMDDIKKIANMDPKKLSKFLGTNKGKEGGLGTIGSVKPEAIVNLAKKFSANPKWFRRAADEPWDQYVDRIATQVPGLGSKTGSLGAVWQDLPNAAVSAVDRHMTELAMPHIMQHPELGPDFSKRVVESWNNVEGNLPVASVEQILAQPEGRIYARDFLASLINNPQAVKMRTTKGAYGANVPEHLQRGAEGWVGAEPAKTNIMNPYYREALAFNQQHVAEGESLFGSQWRLWDHKRGRIEPHEVMYPGLWRLPRMPLDDAKAAYDTHKRAGYALGKPTAKNPVAEGGVLPAVRPVANPMHLGYWSLGGAALGGGLLSAEDEYRQRGGLLLAD
jgi:hypothetical protein